MTDLSYIEINEPCDIEIDEPCFFCKKSTCNGIIFINQKYEDKGLFKNTPKKFINMPEGAESHVECYIHECVRISFEEMIEKTGIAKK